MVGQARRGLALACLDACPAPAAPQSGLYRGLSKCAQPQAGARQTCKSQNRRNLATSRATQRGGPSCNAALASIFTSTPNPRAPSAHTSLSPTERSSNRRTHSRPAWPPLPSDSYISRARWLTATLASRPTLPRSASTSSLRYAARMPLRRFMPTHGPIEP